MLSQGEEAQGNGEVVRVGTDPVWSMVVRRDFQ